MLKTLEQWARTLKRDVYTIWYVARDPETPLLLKLLAFVIAGYAISPIDLIPDFIPIIGYLDDLILIPLGIWIILKYLPQHILDRARLRADQERVKPKSYVTAIIFVMIWSLLSVGCIGYFMKYH